jgi:hypothetical protein
MFEQVTQTSSKKNIIKYSRFGKVHLSNRKSLKFQLIQFHQTGAAQNKTFKQAMHFDHIIQKIVKKYIILSNDKVGHKHHLLSSRVNC